MAFQDNDYVKAPYLQAGDYLKINGTTSGFSMKAGNRGFIYGTNDGTLTMGEEGVPTSIPVLNINAREINWNGRPLEEYFTSTGGSTGGSSEELDELSIRVDDLQTQLTTKVTELKETDADLSSELEDLRLKSLGASVNILQNTLNNSTANVCGIVIPVRLIQDEMNSFNTIRLGGIRNDVNCYVSIYHSDSTTPAVNNQFTLLHKDATLVDASGTDSQQASVDIRLSRNISLPSSGILLVLFSTSRDDPSNTGIDWILDTAVNARLTLSVYAVGTSNPTSSNGVWLFKKSPSPTFVTYVPDVQVAFIGHADDTILHVDSELRGKIDDLVSSSADYMTEAKTNSAIADYRVTGGNSNLGTLVEQLTTAQPYILEKGDMQLQFSTTGMQMTYYNDSDAEAGSCVSTLSMSGYQAEFRADTGLIHTYLYLLPNELRLETTESSWDVSTSSHVVPTISVVHYLIQSALAN